MSEENKSLTNKESIRAVLIGFAIGGLYTIVLMFVFGEEGWYEFDAYSVPISMLDESAEESPISDECKSLIQEYLVYKNYAENKGSPVDDPEKRYEVKLKEKLYGEKCW